MISKNSGGAAQPVSRSMDRGTEAYVDDAKARIPSAIDRSIVSAVGIATEQYSAEFHGYLVLNLTPHW
jgi:hypothetical protein